MAEAPEPEQIAKYKILGFLGQGAMGKVYRGHDPVLNREVAIKTISSIMASDPDLQKRFHREAQAAARLNHPNIITVYEYGEEGDTLYIAMELLEGTDLKGCMETGGLKTLSAKLRIVEQVCDGLTFAHAKGVIHRDLKPANIHVSNAGQVKIMDFGLARLDSGDRSKAGMVVGTPNYMSPEQVMGDEIDARTDVFSLGAVFYELIANKKPFDADSVHGILFQVVHKEPTPIRQVVKELPTIVSEVVQKALAKDRGQRFQTATEFREALAYIEHALAGGRATEARLARSGDSTIVRAGASLMPQPDSGAAPAAAESVDGTVALDIKFPVKRPAPRPGSSATRASAVGLRSSPRPPPRRSFGMLLIVLLMLGLAGAAAVYYKRSVGEPAPEDQEGRSQSASMTVMTFALAKSKAELAREKLQDKDYRQALVIAEEGLRIQSRSPEAQAVRDEARRALDDLEAAAAEARAAAQAGDSDRAGVALSRVLALDPKHPVADEVATQLNSSFQKQADEARNLADAARKEADAAGATTRPAYESATSVIRQAEAQFRGGSFAEAARGFLESRDLFDRARRSAQATPAPAVATAAPTSGQRADLPAPVAEPATPAPTAAEPSAAVERRAFVIGTNRILTRRAGKGVAGFDSSDVSVQQAADLHGQIDIELTPPLVRAGDSYAFKATFTNFDRKPLKIRDVTLTYRINGEARVQTVAPAAREPGANQTVLVAETGGVWEDGIQSWSLEIVVTSDKGESCHREVRLAKR